MNSKQPRKQRKMHFNAPLHKKRKMLASHLAENLLLKYDRRNTTVVKGDTVKVMRGSFRGHEDKVASVNLKKQIVEVEGITTVKADGTKVAKPIHPSNLLITKLNLTDKWRRNKLEKGLSEVTKKEIEKEAEEQIKEQERIESEEKAIAKKEEEEIKEEAEEETEKKKEPIKKEPITEEKKTSAKPTKKPKISEEIKKEKQKPKSQDVKKISKTEKNVKKSAEKNTPKKEDKK